MKQYLDILGKSVIFAIVNGLAYSEFLDIEFNLIDSKNIKLTIVEFLLFTLYHEEVYTDKLSLTIGFFKNSFVKILILAIVSEILQTTIFNIKENGFDDDWMVFWFNFFSAIVVYDFVIKDLVGTKKTTKHKKVIDNSIKVSFILIFSKLLELYILQNPENSLTSKWLLTTVFSIMSLSTYTYLLGNNKTLTKYDDYLKIFIYFIFGNFFYNMTNNEFKINKDILELSSSWAIGLLVSNFALNNIFKKSIYFEKIF